MGGRGRPGADRPREAPSACRPGLQLRGIADAEDTQWRVVACEREDVSEVEQRHQAKLAAVRERMQRAVAADVAPHGLLVADIRAPRRTVDSDLPDVTGASVSARPCRTAVRRRRTGLGLYIKRRARRQIPGWNPLSAGTAGYEGIRSFAAFA